MSDSPQVPPITLGEHLMSNIPRQVQVSKWGRRGAAMVAMSFLASACAHTATVSRVDGTKVEAKILDADAESVTVQTEGGTQTLLRSDITDIDHPGNAAMLTGVALAALGAIQAKEKYGPCKDAASRFGSSNKCIGHLWGLGVGIPMTIYGLVVWMKSTSSMRIKKSVGVGNKVTLAPMLDRYGAAVTLGF